MENSCIKTENGGYVPKILIDITCNQDANGEISLLKSIINENPNSIIFDVGATKSTFPLYSNTCKFHMFDPEFEFEDGVDYSSDNCFVNKFALDSTSNTIDSYCYKHGIKNIDFLKIDTDGHDVDVLKSALNILPTVKYVQIEHDMFSLLRNQKASDFYEILGDFKLFKITYDGLKKVEKIKENYIYSNYLFTRDESICYEPLVKDLTFFKNVFWEVDPNNIEYFYNNYTGMFKNQNHKINLDDFLSKYYYRYIKGFIDV